jgi:ATPase family AAA domain-containing protein 2
MTSLSDLEDDSSSVLSLPSSELLQHLSKSFSPGTMPARPSSKRTLEEAATLEESGDDDYDDKAPRPSKSRSKRSRHRGKPARKKLRRTYGSGSDDGENEGDSDSLLSGSYSESEKEEEPVEVNEHGRPVRQAAKTRITYEESDSEDGDSQFGRQSSGAEEEITPPKSKKPTQKLIVKLRTGTPGAKSARLARNLRKRSGSHSSKPPPTPTEVTARGTRRSSRLSHDDEETLVGLTNSGRHAEVVRAGSRDPDVPVRYTRGGKGIKHPSKSTIDEASQEDSNRDTREEVLEIKASQHEIMESDPQTQGEAETEMPRILSDIQAAAKESGGEEEMEDGTGFVAESQELVEEVEQEEDDDDGPISRGRATRASNRQVESPPEESTRSSGRLRTLNLRSQASKQPSRSSQRKANEESSDFEPDGDHEKEDEMSASEESEKSPQKDEYESSNSRRSRRLQRSKKTASRQSPISDDEGNLAEEVAELKAGGRKRKPRQHDIVYEPRRTRGPRGNVDYRLLRPELNVPMDDAEEDPAPTPTRRRAGGAGGGGGGWQRSLFSTYGPFGGAGGPAPILGGPGGIGAAGGVDSDSSDDEGLQRPKPVGGTVGMTPTSAFGPGFGLLPAAQPLNADAAQGATGTPANLGRVKDKHALADADPLGVDQYVTFDGVGGLQGHIDQLKEMVALPLLYPEIFMRFKITPPRGVLFHGPPGTGKTLLARALASSVSSQGKKVTFYMRKGADALSKWVGEAEKQLRMLFEEARRTQPSIIFFDEIDGMLCPAP